MTRLYVVEQSSLEPGGHYFGYTCCVVAAARQLGLEAVVLGNRRFADSAAARELGIIPVFTHGWSEAERDGALDWVPGNIAYEMVEAFRRLPPAADDHVFLHTFGYRELRALLAWLTGKLPGDPLPYVHLLLRRDPDQLIEHFRDYAGYFALLAASPYLRDKVRLHADTTLLAEAFTRVCGVPFATAPIPFDQDLLRQALAERPPRRPGDPLTVAYLGDAREEKGYQHLPQALSHLWRDYVATGRVRFVLQSNFNTPGGEPGILRAAQTLAAFPSATLTNEPLSPADYYRIVAAADIVLLPYSPRLYRYRSSGVLVEAMAAGKVVVTCAGSWMATQVTAEHAVLYDAPADLGPAIAAAIDRYETLAAGAEARRAATLAGATAAGLVRHLLAAAAPTADAAPRPRRRVLFVMNGDAMVLHNDASRPASAQLRYLTAAGFDIVALFLSYLAPDDAAAFARWRTSLARQIAPCPLERVFVAGPARLPLDPEQAALIRDRRQRDQSALRAEFDFTAAFDYPAALLRHLRARPVDVVMLNYITNYPVVEALGLESTPVVCEMHCVQSVQRAIFRQRPVDPVDLDEEMRWLGRCAALVSLSAREAAMVRERLPDARIETTGVLLPPPSPPLPLLAGAKDLAEIVASARPAMPEYRGEPSEVARRLGEADALDLLYVGPQHMAHASGLRWFLTEVYEPYLAAQRVTMIVAGAICGEDGPINPRIFLVDQVEDLAPLYAAARIVVLPILEGAGSPVETFEALVHGRPIVGTTAAFRGIDAELGGLAIHDEPRDFATAVLDLLGSPRRRAEAASRSRRIGSRCNNAGRYFGIMDRIMTVALGDNRIKAPPPPPPAASDPIEWSRPLQAINLLVRGYLDGEPLLGWAVDLLVREPDATIDPLLEAISRSLLVDCDAAVLRSEFRLKRLAGDLAAPRLREAALLTIRLAIAGRRGTPPPVAESATAVRVVVYGGLPLTVAGSVAASELKRRAALHIDGRAVAIRLLPGGTARKRAYQAEIAALDGDHTGLRMLDLAAAGCASPPGIAVLRQTVPIGPAARVYDRAVFGPGFRVRADGSAADLPPGGSGEMVLPRLIDGTHPGYVDLCFASTNAAAPSMMVDGTPAIAETIAIGDATLVRVSLDTGGGSGDFGVATLTLVNNSRSILSLVGAHSGLFLQPDTAAEIATMLTRADAAAAVPDGDRLVSAAGEAIATIIAQRPLATGDLDALCALSAGPASALRDLAAREIARSGRADGAARPSQGDRDVLLADIATIVDAGLGSGGAATAIISPALPFAIVGADGLPLEAETAAALAAREGSWRVALPVGARGERIRIRLDATLEVPGHPGVITFENFYPPENLDVLFRWTGPGPTSTVTLPLALSQAAQLVVELGPTGSNTASEHFALSCNGERVAHRLSAKSGSVILTAQLPPARFAAPSTAIALTVSECHAPAPPDRRTLGVVFQALTLYLGDLGPAPDGPPAAGEASVRPPEAARRGIRPRRKGSSRTKREL